MKFQVLITRDGEGLVAEVLQKYFVVQAQGFEQLLQRFLSTLWAYKTLDKLDGIDPLSSLDPAKPRVWQEYENAEPFVFDEQVLVRAREGFEFPELEFRQR